MPLRLDPYSLRLFVTAADEGSIARAAAKEHIAPSALSRRIADLEHAFGLALFVRSAHGIALTEAGQAAYERARHFEATLESLLRDVQSLSGVVSGRVRLFANASAVIGFLPERLKAFSAAFPMVSIELQERLSGDVAASLPRRHRRCWRRRHRRCPERTRVLALRERSVDGGVASRSCPRRRRGRSLPRSRGVSARVHPVGGRPGSDVAGSGRRRPPEARTWRSP